MVVVQNNQTLLDICVIYDGTCLTAFEWATANALSVTDKLVVGQELIDPNSVLKNQAMIAFFLHKKINLGTGIQNSNSFGFPSEFPISL